MSKKFRYRITTCNHDLLNGSAGRSTEIDLDEPITDERIITETFQSQMETVRPKYNFHDPFYLSTKLRDSSSRSTPLEEVQVVEIKEDGSEHIHFDGELRLAS